MASKRQESLPGLSKKTIKEIEDAAENYREKRNTRMKHTDKEVEAKTSLIEMMKKHGQSMYKCEDFDPPLLITLKPGKDQVKVEDLENEEQAAEALEG